jgi:lipopolysaccharide export system permease protein
MKKLDLYLIREMTRLVVRIVCALLGLFILIDILTHRRPQIIAHDVEWFIVAKYYLFLIPQLLHDYQVGALSVLIAGLLIMGRIAQRQELTAILSSGISLRRIVMGPVLVALFCSGGLFALGELAGPTATQNSIDIEKRYFGADRKGDRGGRSGVLWPNLDNGWQCDVQKFNREAMTGEQVLILGFFSDRTEKISVDRIYWDSNESVWIMERGNWGVLYDEGNTSRRITQEVAPFKNTPEQLFAAEVDSGAYSSRELNQIRNEYPPINRTGRTIAVDYHLKFSSPMLCFVMIWLAIPFAVKLGRGNMALGITLSVFIGLAYLLVFLLTTSLGYSGVINPLLSAWLANGLFLIFGAFLFYRTPT